MKWERGALSSCANHVTDELKEGVPSCRWASLSSSVQWVCGRYLAIGVPFLLALGSSFCEEINHTQPFHIVDSRTGVPQIDST